MPLDFPAAPTTGQIFTAGSSSWRFDGVKWNETTGALAIPDAPSDGNTYGRQNAAWNSVNAMLAPVSTTANTALTNAAAAQTTATAALNDSGRNRLNNSAFRINQRNYTSGTALAAAAYGHDRWKAGASGCTYTFTATPPATTITITAGSLQQIVEALDVVGGTYTLSWTGTAQGRVGAGTYAASPVTVTGLAANTNITVEFNAGTLGTVQLEAGSVATQYERLNYRNELANCQRFYATGHFVVTGYGGASSSIAYALPPPVTMRATPALAVSNTSVTNTGTVTAAVFGGDVINFSATVTATGVASIQGMYTASADL